MDLLRGGLNRFTFDLAIDGFPVWSPDGTQIAFESFRKGHLDIYLKPSNGVGTEIPLRESVNLKWPFDWSKDGRFLLYQETGPKTAYNIWALPMKGNDRKPIAVSNTPFKEDAGQFSPDARWVAYVTDETGRFEVVVQPFPNPTFKRQVSIGGGGHPRWRSDGKELFFISPDGKMMASQVHPSTSSFESETPTALFQTRIFNEQYVSRPQYAVSADGRFLINQTVEESKPAIMLILNWKPKP
jgi:Tol biopolymer transport system component